MSLRRRFNNRMKASARFLSNTVFWMRRGHAPWAALAKARVTL